MSPTHSVAVAWNQRGAAFQDQQPQAAQPRSPCVGPACSLPGLTDVTGQKRGDPASREDSTFLGSLEAGVHEHFHFPKRGLRWGSPCCHLCRDSCGRTLRLIFIHDARQRLWAFLGRASF